jgi:hypothetical protein
MPRFKLSKLETWSQTHATQATRMLLKFPQPATNVVLRQKTLKVWQKARYD